LPGQADLVKNAAMEGDRNARAAARIEAAAQRIEAAAGRSTGALRQAQDDRPDLAARYHALRSEAGEALAELDRVIGSLES
jgi:hypothetical protein